MRNLVQILILPKILCGCAYRRLDFYSNESNRRMEGDYMLNRDPMLQSTKTNIPRLENGKEGSQRATEFSYEETSLEDKLDHTGIQRAGSNSTVKDGNIEDAESCLE